MDSCNSVKYTKIPRRDAAWISSDEGKTEAEGAIVPKIKGWH